MPAKRTPNSGNSKKGTHYSSGASNAANRSGERIENILLAKVDLERAFGELKFIDQVVLCYRYIEGQQLDEIADRLNKHPFEQVYNTDTVRMIEKRALEKLRQIMDKGGKK